MFADCRPTRVDSVGLVPRFASSESRRLVGLVPRFLASESRRLVGLVPRFARFGITSVGRASATVSRFDIAPVGRAGAAIARFRVRVCSSGWSHDFAASHPSLTKYWITASWVGLPGSQTRTNPSAARSAARPHRHRSTACPHCPPPAPTPAPFAPAVGEHWACCPIR